MSGYYYSREAGAEGQILTGEGTAPGIGLDVLVERERPPLKAGLAIGSALADLLCIAEEDRLVHGDIRPSHVRIDARGTVSVEGFGVARRTTRAPEGRPDTAAADMFGLGVVLHSLLSAELLGDLPPDPDGHDDAVVSRVLSMDFREVQGKRWLEEVRKFLCQILAYTPDDRPAALDAANVLASVAGQCPGEALEAWAARASAAQPAAARPAAAPVRAAVADEELGGPVALAGPLASGGARKAPAAKGESTSFWSREKIAAMLADEDDDEDDSPLPPRMPAAAKPAPPKPAPVKSSPPPQAPPKPAPPKPGPVRASPPPPAPDASYAPGLNSVRFLGPQAGAGGPAKSSASPESASAYPFGGAGIYASQNEPDAPPEKSKLGLVLGVVGVLMVLLCGVASLVGGAWWFMGAPETAAALAPTTLAPPEGSVGAPGRDAPTEIKVEGAEATDPSTGTTGATPAAAPSAAPAATPAVPPPAATRAATPTSTPGPARSTAPRPPPAKPAPVAALAAPAAPTPTAGYAVKFSTPGREAKLQCGDGQSTSFAGSTTLSFTGTVTCLVRIDSGKGAVQVTKSAQYTCSEDAGKVLCSGG